MEGNGKNLTVFIPVNGNTYRADVVALEDIADVVGYVVKNCGVEEKVRCVEDCPFDADQLNDWDDDMLETMFDGNEEEYEAAKSTLDELLNGSNAEEYVKMCWAVEVKGSKVEFIRMLRDGYKYKDVKKD